MSDDTPNKKRVAIVGAGPVGVLAAIYFAQRAWDVSLFDLRPDMRLPENKARNQGRSINLALSTRGISALHGTGLSLDEEILKCAVPMKGRMIHLGKEGKLQSQPYGVRDEHINAVDRTKLNEDLLEAAEKFSNVKIYFDHTFKKADLDAGTVEFESRNGESVVFEVDFIIGADGAYSSVRYQLMRKVRMDYHQEYIDTAYCELTIPPKIDTDGDLEYAMDSNHLHIWPRKSFMLIALPNPCNPYHYKDRALIIGDAAHAMVPFYGQGMNCGFEDVQVLADILDEHKITNTLPHHHPEDSKGPQELSPLEIALEKYTKLRHADVVAMCDLALYNHYEMRSAVTSRTYLVRKYLEVKLHLLFPTQVIPLYTMISFSRIRYSEAVVRWQAQTWWLNAFGWSTASGTMLMGLMLGLRYGKDMMQTVTHAARTIGDTYMKGA
ncbi:hypothetical protein BC936DRAFT_141960 [Jimgerdemannia flammicorona]|uniref:Kynurenine 3-monooxygenase n=1 Tax=Jimgerdemannia flammicorona TaxID=994334 RepID=A0A433DNG6_9FUNG|nr:hypothetical protein BC936DRAFT_141960 [Jimgerdemannia flammicorona]